MYIAYSALQTIAQPAETQTNENNFTNELTLRYQAYQTICSKYTREIAAIQKYLPGWQPAFR
jgi:hypothetical protein